MPRFTKDEQVIETSNAREGAQLRAMGFKESKARTADVREADADQVDQVELTEPVESVEPETAAPKRTGRK